MNSILEFTGYDAVNDTSMNEALAFAKGNGFTRVWIVDESPLFLSEKLSIKQAKELKLIAQQQGITVTLHAANVAVSLSQPSQYLIGRIRDYYTG